MFNEDGLLTITLTAVAGHPERERVVCTLAIHRELIWDTQASSCRSPASSQKVTTLVALARDGPLYASQGGTMRNLPGQQAWPSLDSVELKRLYAGRPWQVITVNLLSPMPPSLRGKNWILVLTNYFTRWADAWVIPGASTPTVARALDQHVFCYLSLPEQIHMDQVPSSSLNL